MNENEVRIIDITAAFSGMLLMKEIEEFHVT